MKNKFKKLRNKRIISFIVSVVLILILLFIPNLESKSVDQAKHAVDKAVNDVSKKLNDVAQESNNKLQPDK
ncbi:hypothetical protein [Allofrancisella frigidaquae]|uniref:Uncharacterized protein n=1 Tax=Allofrancisella frigidaquae TaxID=1085644 RepID=A0A6M3HT37_9GAMM|nr:hypothetical protein [Allofrancisella frigidaquae]KEI34668.1 hypothetical protein FRA_50c15420 [Francisella sp. W12-1067]QIV94240.1 hypothetical protein E3E15_02270 [Allofrancisella frigidaquae]